MSLESKRIQIGNGIFLNLIKTDKFKSNLLSFYFTRPLIRKEVTLNALLPLVLKRGTRNYPTKLDIEKKLEENYGANLSIDVNKRGEKQVTRYTMEWVPETYLDNEDFNYEIIEILKEIIYNPILEDEAFNKEYVIQEKENLKRIIQGKINSKRSYAIDRCIEEMCKNERFSLYQLGYIEDLEDIDEKKLYRHYQYILETSPIEIFYVGDYNNDLVDFLKKENSIERKEIISIPDDQIIPSVQTKNMIQEELDVNQGKLVIGYRTGITFKDKLYDALLIGSNILGGSPNSKLFKNVREKESLAYYISTSIFKYKSILFIDAGIEFDDFDKTVEIIKQELDNLRAGKFTEKDMDLSFKSLKASIESIKDSIFLISEYFFSQLLSGDNRNIEEVIQGLSNVSKEEIIEVSNKIDIDTIYFMKNKSQ
ncbi:MAG TPA: insulinase family protein [Tissierellaceae bacterium]|nr:insulinase family protein [Tissierellaceae bacterium]